MCKAQMKCRGCGREYPYSGLSSKSSFCPHCSTRNEIPGDALSVESDWGIPY